MAIYFNQRGSVDKMTSFLTSMTKIDDDIMSILRKHGERGVAALRSATPKDSGLAAESWGYDTFNGAKGVSINWTNSNVENGFPVVIALQYGYATGTGGYVQGRDFINPAIRPIFDEIADEIWRKVVKA